MTPGQTRKQEWLRRARRRCAPTWSSTPATTSRTATPCRCVRDALGAAARRARRLRASAPTTTSSRTLRNPLRYLLPDDGKRHTDAPQLPWRDLRTTFTRRRLARPHQPPRRAAGRRHRRSPSPASTTRTWSYDRPRRRRRPRRPRRPTCASASRTRRTCGCSTSSPPTGTTRSSPATPTAVRCACPAVGALTTNCDLEPRPGQGPAPAPRRLPRPGDPGSAWLHVCGRSRHQPVRPDPGRLPPRGDAADAGAPDRLRARPDSPMWGTPWHAPVCSRACGPVRRRSTSGCGAAW